jgi:hypothetical protein
MLRSGLLGGLALAVMLPAGAARVGGGVDGPGMPAMGPSLTVYMGNLALVRQQVERLLEPGAHTVRVDGLPTNLDASSLIVLSEGVTLQGVHGQRNYQEPATGPGASLELDLDVRRRVQRLELAYLTTGLSWSADYAVIIARDDASARVDGYATLANNSGTTYEGAELQLLAGSIQRGRGRFEPPAARMAQALEEAAAPELQEAAFGDYHLYTVSTPLTLRAGESRRIRLLGAEAVRTRKEYTFSHSANYRRQSPEPLTRPVAVSYGIERAEDSEFGGVPLPGGQVRMLQRDEEGRVQLLGIAAIPNTPKGEELRLSTGYAFDIVGTRTQTDYRRPSGNVHEAAWKVELRNRGGSAVTVQVIEQLSGDWSIVESSQRWEKLSAGAVRFRVDVAAGGVSVLEYRVSVKT